MKTCTHTQSSPKTLTTPKICYLIYMRMPETHLQCGYIVVDVARVGLQHEIFRYQQSRDAET